VIDVDAVKQKARDAIEGASGALIELSHRIQANPELAFEEHQASGWVAEILEANGFAVDRGVAGLPTAFAATAGTGDLAIGLCAEYDALPEVGHACGHNVIAAASVGTAIALAGLGDELGLTVRVLGTPAEEKGGGKVLMLERGAFDGIHAAMLVHPGPFGADEVSCTAIACSELVVEYTGRAAHAAGYPHLGLNAADAATIAQVGVGLLRQHFEPGDRVHGIVTHGGGAPNVIPERTTLSYYVRASKLERLEALEQRVRACFEAGALATGCRVEITHPGPTYSHFEGDRDLEALYAENLSALGTKPQPPDPDSLYSTDMANISLALPTIHPTIGIDSGESVNHQAEFAAHCVEPSADEALVRGATAMAWTCIDAATNDEVRMRLLAGRRAPSSVKGEGAGEAARTG
jgi:amidohydrolase